MNKVDPTKKIHFTIEVATDTLEFLDFKFKFNKQSKQISVDVFAKHTNSFRYVLSSTCFPRKTLKASLKVLIYVLDEFAILMKNLKSVVQNIKVVLSLGIKSLVK